MARSPESALIQKWLDEHPKSVLAPSTQGVEYIPAPRPKHMHAETKRVRRDIAALWREIRERHEREDI